MTIAFAISRCSGLRLALDESPFLQVAVNFKLPGLTTLMLLPSEAVSLDVAETEAERGIRGW
jgi:hypothetical protein